MRLSRVIGVVVVVMSLANPASARSRDGHQIAEPDRPSIVQLLKQWVVRAFGDGLIVPRP